MGVVEEFMGSSELMKAASQMGSEATIRFLTAKLKVLQEELDHVNSEFAQKEERLAKAETQNKELIEENKKLLKVNQGLQTQVDKLSKAADEGRSKLTVAQTEVAAAKKESETLERNLKQVQADASSLEVRLNRALEEAERYKKLSHKAHVEAKDEGSEARRVVDRLMVENKRLEKQKGELMQAFKKQLKLIDVLKRQKVHIEAARMLQFTEEEFVKTLDWAS
eukprot:Colp12_sorted_trinity150504_noHs@19442